MAEERYDVIVIGGGPGGYLAAERAGNLGKKVLLLEKERLGGVCLNWGCVPTKCLLNSAKLYHMALNSEQFGVSVETASFDLAVAMAWKNQVVDAQVKGIEFLMKRSKVTVVAGEGRLLDRNTVTAGGKSFTGDSIILATGSSPVSPPIPGIESSRVVTSRDVLDISELPSRMVIIGGGVIGLEFAAFFSMVGVDVTVIELLPEIISILDKDITSVLRRAIPDVTFHLDARVTAIEPDGVSFKQGSKKGRADADIVLMAVGRRPNISDIGIENAGIEADRAGIRVNDYMQTNVPGVYAIGDVTGKSLLAHSAYRMAEVAVNHAAGKPDRMRYHAIPWVVYTHPEAAGAGLTEREAETQGREVRIAKVPMRINGRFLAEHGKAQGLCKVVVDKHTDVLLGVQMVGGACSEIIYGASAMIEGEFRARDIREVLFPHPTVSEVIKDALWELE